MVSRRSWYERPRISLPAVTIKDMAAAAKPCGSWGFSGPGRPTSLIRIEMLAAGAEPGSDLLWGVTL